jgi:hypothetical protein
MHHQYAGFNLRQAHGQTSERIPEKQWSAKIADREGKKVEPDALGHDRRHHVEPAVIAVGT